MEDIGRGRCFGGGIRGRRRESSRPSSSRAAGHFLGNTNVVGWEFVLEEGVFSCIVRSWGG